MWRTSLASPLGFQPCYTLLRFDQTIRSASSKSNAKSTQQPRPKASGPEKAANPKSMPSSQREHAQSDTTRFGPTKSSPSKTTLKKTTVILQQSVGSRNEPHTSGAASAHPSAALGSTSIPSPSVSPYIAPTTYDLRPRTKVVSQLPKSAQEYVIHPGDSQQFTLPDGLKMGYAIYGSKSPKAQVFLGFHGTPGTRLSYHQCHQWGLDNGVSIICPERPGYALSSLKKFDILKHARDAQILMKSLGFTTYKVFGTSGGGSYALGLNYIAGGEVLGTVLMVPAAPPEAPQDGAILRTVFWRKRVSRLLKLTRAQYFWRRGAYHSEMDQKKEMGRPELYRNFQDGRKYLVKIEENSSSSAEGYILDWHAITRDWGFRLDSLDSNRILIFGGGLDANTPLPSIRWMCRKLKNAELMEEIVMNHTTMQAAYMLKALKYLKRL